MYEILNAAPSNVGKIYAVKFKSIIPHLNFETVAELDLILRKNEEARSLDVDHFHDMIRTAQDSDDQILKVLQATLL